MSLQFILDNCVHVSFNRRKLVGIQYTKNETARTELTPTKNAWKFSVSMPALPYYIMRPVLETLTTLDRNTSAIVNFNSSKIQHVFRRQTNVTFATPLNVVSFNGDQLVVNNLPAVAAGTVLLKAGDLIQVDTFPYPYTVATDFIMPAAASGTITTHRPNIVSGIVANKDLIIGPPCSFTVFCPNMPNYKLVPGNRIRDASGAYINASLVEFDSDFEFFEWTYNS